MSHGAAGAWPALRRARRRPIDRLSPLGLCVSVSCATPAQKPAATPDMDATSPHDTAIPLAVAGDDVTSEGALQSWSRNAAALAEISADGLVLTGTASYVYSFGDAYICDADIRLDGVASDHLCEGCDFAFDMSGEITRDEGRADCEMGVSTTFIETDRVKNPIFAFAEHYPIWREGYGWVEYQDVALVGASFDLTGSGGGYYPGPYWYPMYWDGPTWDEGWASWSDETVSWGDADLGTFYGLNYYAYCWTGAWSEATEGYPGRTTEGSVTCSTGTMDGFAFAAEAGDVLTVTVDTVDSETDFDPTFFVNGPDGCAVTRADDNFICTPALEGTFGEESLAVCPASRFVAPSTGTYTIWLLSTGLYCNLGSTVSYALRVSRNP